MSKKVVPGEWQTEVNAFGGVHRYRMVGNVKEYEPTVTIDGIDIPESQVEDYNRRRKEQAAAQIEQNRRAAAQAAPLYSCPFKGANNCTREKCALYVGRGCALARIAERATADTDGKACPFSPYSCRKTCGLYKNGCVLTAINERNVME